MDVIHIVLAIIICLIIIYAYYAFKYSYHNTTPVKACDKCEEYNVHRSHGDQKTAAEIMQQVTKRNHILIEYLRNKYLNNQFIPGVDPTKGNRIDVIPQAEMTNEYIQERISQLINKYDPDSVYEISPLNTSGVTSYTQDKRTLILCLRHKEKDANGNNELHDINTIMFVVVHELSHMMNDLWGHKINFWILFKFMLQNSVDCEVYKPVNYALHPIKYCGLALSYNPLYDTSI